MVDAAADPQALYRLLSWLSPSYPVGAFSYSHGLEYAVETGTVGDLDSLTAWTETVLLRGTGRIDGVLFREAYCAVEADDADALDEIRELGNAFQATAEFALESRAQGDAFVRATRSAWPVPALDRLADGAVYPVAVAVGCAGHGIPVEVGLHGYFHAFSANLVSAGVRLIPLGQTDGQRAVAALAAAVERAQQNAMNIPLEDLGAAAPVLDLASMHHETQYTRLFRS